MPTIQSHLENLSRNEFLRDILPTAADKATPVIAAGGYAVWSWRDQVHQNVGVVADLIPYATLAWLFTQIMLAWGKSIWTWLKFLKNFLKNKPSA
jgi:hypothetical protein